MSSSSITFDTGAAPLMPLRDRDLKTLIDVFTLTPQEQTEIEADLLLYFQHRIPEICWDEDPFDFLRDYL